MGSEYRICVECLENGYEVVIPDVDAINKAQAAYEKDPAKNSRPWPGSSEYSKSYAAKTVSEVIALVTPALKKLPAKSYEAAFEDAAAEYSKTT